MEKVIIISLDENEFQYFDYNEGRSLSRSTLPKDYEGWVYFHIKDGEQKGYIVAKAYLELTTNFRELSIWKFDKYEVLKSRMRLSEFYIFVRKTVHGGLDHPPYTDDVRTQLSVAPKDWRYVWIKSSDE